ASSNKNSTIAGTDALLTPFRKLVFKWLNRRGQRRSYRWRSFRRMLDRFQIHHPSVGAGSSEVMRELSHCTDKHQARLACVNLLGAAHVAAGARASWLSLATDGRPQFVCRIGQC